MQNTKENNYNTETNLLTAENTKKDFKKNNDQNTIAISKKGEPKTAESAGFFELFKFASKKDKIMMVFAAILSSIQGLLLPGMMLIFGDFTENMTDAVDPATAKANITEQALIMIYLGIVVFVTSTIAIVLWTITGRNQMINLRSEYFRNVILKNASWYDKEKPGKLASAYYEHLGMFVQVYGNKLHILFQIIAMTISGFAVGFYKGWSMSLIMLAISPIMIIGLTLFMYYVGQQTAVEKDAYSDAGALSDQTFEYIRTVKSLKGEEHEIAKYSESLLKVGQASKRFSCKIDVLYGFFYFSWTFIYALSFWVGNIILYKKWFNDNSQAVYSVGDYITIFFAVTTGVSGFSVLAPIQKSIASAKIAMARIKQIVNNNNLDESGDKVPNKSTIKGEIRFENVSFAYPTHPDQFVLKNVSFTITPGEKFAIVGPSGSGKSTIIQLLERFYDPTEGRILLDGMDIREIDIDHYRMIMGLVSQQPILFADTIRNNLIIGLENRKEAFKDEEIWKSLERANVKSFITDKLEDGLETYVGNQGSQLSGGQKQRISIARVLLRNPCVFLFDEATSALDRQNEKEIQETIDEVCNEVTSVSIAHRLQTIKNSDQIIVLVDGEIKENGNHEQLMEIDRGVYNGLYMRQDKTEMNNEEEEEQKELSQSKFEHNKVMDEMSAYSEHQLNESNKLSIRESKTGSRKNSQAMDDELAKKQEEEKSKEKPKKKKLLHILTSFDYLSGSEVCMVIMGVISSAFVGVVMPFLGYYFGKVLAVYGQYDFINKIPANDNPVIRESLWDKGMEFFYVMVGISVGSFLFSFLQFLFFGKVSIKFVIKVRKVLFRKFIYKDVEYFDQPENKPGNLSAKLSNDCSLIRTLVSNYFGSILQSMSSFFLGLGFGFYFSWRITLLVIGLSPLLILSGVMESMMFYGNTSSKVKEDENIVQETFNNIKMVKSLVSENAIHQKYMESIKIGNKKTFKKNLCLSIMLGISQFGQFIVFALIFYAAGVWREKYGLDMMKLFTAIFSLIFGVYGAGMANQFIGDIGKAQNAAANIFSYINEVPELEFDPHDPLYAKAKAFQSKDEDFKQFINKVNENHKVKTSRVAPELQGNIEFKNVWFKFPTRNKYTLRGFNLKFTTGSNCAIVGASGSGKSTIFQLLMRFYDPNKGQILIDGHDIKTIDLRHLRSFFGLIKQEPEIFNGNIGYNIVYNTENKTEEDIQNACNTSNSQEFIDLHNEGRERSAGNRGDALSGGQKQRLTIARVILRNPKIYLFDEATSALDSHSEKVVQNAIEKIWGSNSSLTIAHRFSTIKNCDKIFVMQRGKVAEKGTYDELMMRKGIFYGLAVD